MKTATLDDLKNLYLPPPDSHKGQNGKLMIIGGSHLFHAASIWALEVASRIVDLVHYSSVPENNKIVITIKKKWRDGIVVPRGEIEQYIKEDECILIGPGMVRSEASKIPNPKSQIPNKSKIQNLKEINEIQDEGEQTKELTNYLLAKYPTKQWVIDAGSLQMMDISLIPKNAILTPHHGEFNLLWEKSALGGSSFDSSRLAGLEKTRLPALSDVEKVEQFAQNYHCIVLLKGQRDIAASPTETRVIEGGNAGMTKGGTGDVLAGLIAALACKNDPFLATIAGSFINKKAGEELYKNVGPFFNASDLAKQIPQTLKQLLLS